MSLEKAIVLPAPRSFLLSFHIHKRQEWNCQMLFHHFRRISIHSTALLALSQISRIVTLRKHAGSTPPLLPILFLCATKLALTFSFTNMDYPQRISLNANIKQLLQKLKRIGLSEDASHQYLELQSFNTFDSCLPWTGKWIRCYNPIIFYFSLLLFSYHHTN